MQKGDAPARPSNDNRRRERTIEEKAEMPGTPSPMNPRALIVAPYTISEAVMAQPLLALLRQQDPGLRIDALCPARTAMVFRAMAEVSEVIEGLEPEPEATLRLAARWRLGRRLRSRRYARAYVLAEDRGAAWIPWFAGIAQRIGYRGDAYGLPLNRVHETADARTVPRAEYYAGLAFEPGGPPPGKVRDPRLQRRPDTERAVRARFGFGRDAPPIVLCPGAAHAGAYRWPTRHFAALAHLLAQAWPRNELLLLGSPAGRSVATEIAALSGRALRNLCGETSPEEASAIVSQAAGVVSGDTGLMHLAAAFGRPQVAVFGPSDPHRAPPRSARSRVEWQRLECIPCYDRACSLAHHACMSRITPTAVFESLGRVMRFETSGARPIR